MAAKEMMESIFGGSTLMSSKVLAYDIIRQFAINNNCLKPEFETGKKYFAITDDIFEECVQKVMEVVSNLSENQIIYIMNNHEEQDMIEKYLARMDTSIFD